MVVKILKNHENIRSVRVRHYGCIFNDGKENTY